MHQYRYLGFIILAVLALSLSSAALAADVPTTLTPKDGATLTSPNQTFTWDAVDGTTKYRLIVNQVGAPYKFRVVMIPGEANCSGGTCSHTPSGEDWKLRHAKEYRWKVVAKGDYGSGVTKVKDKASFTTNFPVPGAFNISSPVNGSTMDKNAAPTFNWNEASGAVEYKLILKAPNKTKLVSTNVQANSVCSGGTCTYASSALKQTGQYVFKVKAINEYGKSKANTRFNVVKPDSYANQLLTLVNQARCDAGKAPLALNDKLIAAAERHSKDMGDNNFFDHTGSDGSKFNERIRDAGYSYTTAGENIGAGYSSVESVFNGWMNSEGHRKNILNGNFREMGIYWYQKSGSDYFNYWTQNFGARNSDVLGVCP